MSFESFKARMRVKRLTELEQLRKQIIEETTDKELLEIKLKEIDSEIEKIKND